MDPFPLLTPARRIGDPRCGWLRTLSSDPCAHPATWHVAWHLTPSAQFSLLCDPHMAHTQDHFVYTDRHPAAIACDMPGTGWHYTATPSYCDIPPHHAISITADTSALEGALRTLQQTIAHTAETLASAVRTAAEAFTQHPATEDTPKPRTRDRPAWQSPYGPPRKRNRP